jgi:DNA-directed RNA polymerase delta subunit
VARSETVGRTLRQVNLSNELCPELIKLSFLLILSRLGRLWQTLIVDGKFARLEDRALGLDGLLRAIK